MVLKTGVQDKGLIRLVPARALFLACRQLSSHVLTLVDEELQCLFLFLKE